MDLNNHKAKVAWDDICASREEEGLGLHRSKDWNDASMSKHLKSSTHIVILFRLGVKRHRLKNKSIWEVNPLKESLWWWKKLLR